MRILIIEDHAVVRQGLRLILADHFKKAVFGEARNATEGLARVWKQKWDVVVLDITMPGISGLAVLNKLKEEMPRLPVLMLSMHSGEHYVSGSLKAGAAGYLSKESAPEELVTAIHTVMEGKTYVSQSLGPRPELKS